MLPRDAILKDVGEIFINDNDLMGLLGVAKKRLPHNKKIKTYPARARVYTDEADDNAAMPYLVQQLHENSVYSNVLLRSGFYIIDIYAGSTDKSVGGGYLSKEKVSKIAERIKQLLTDKIITQTGANPDYQKLRTSFDSLRNVPLNESKIKQYQLVLMMRWLDMGAYKNSPVTC